MKSQYHGSVQGSLNGTIGKFTIDAIGSLNIFWQPLVPMVDQLVPMVPLVGPLVPIGRPIGAHW